MGYWKVWAAVLVLCRWFRNRRLHYAGLRFVSQQEHLFLHNFGTFSISSFLFHFLLSENNLTTISTQLPESWWMLVLCSGNPTLILNFLRIKCQDYIKHNTKADTMTHAPLKTQNCSYFRLENKPAQNRSRNIYIFFSSSYFHVDKIPTNCTGTQVC